MDAASSSLLILAGAVLVFLVARSTDPRTRPILALGLAAHLVSTFALVTITREVYGYGDLMSYMRQGQQLARYARLTGHLDQVVEVATGGTPHFPFWLIGAGSATGNMSGLTGLAYLLFQGDWAVNLTFSLIAFSGQLATFVALRPHVDTAWERRLAIGCLLVPSMVFWTSGAVKEAPAVGGLGWTILALSSIADRKFARGVGLGAAGSVLVSLTKPYLLFPLAASASVFLYWRRRSSESEDGDVRIGLGRLLLVSVTAVLAIVAMGAIFPDYAVSNLGEEAAHKQEVGARTQGGSNIEVGDSSDRSLAGQLAYAPLAIFSTLFRPLPFEISGALLLINSVEVMGFVLLLYLAWRRRTEGLITTVKRSPVLMFCVVMTLTMALGMGLTTTNLGTLSRYRVPMLPFYASLLLILSMRTAQPAGAPEKRRSLAPARRPSARPRRFDGLG